MSGIGRAAQDELAPSAPAAGPREQSAKIGSRRGALRATGGGSDNTEALAADLGRDAQGGGLNGGRVLPLSPNKNIKKQTERHYTLVD